MKIHMKYLGIFLFLIFLTITPLFSQESQDNNSRMSVYKLSLIIGASIITITAVAGGLSQAKAMSSAFEGISRNPASAPHIRFLLIFGLVLIETLVIYALLISIIILMIKWGNYA
ncbi:MAG: ATP synthase F0 subunit C [Candidatus Aminicenantaceae bacterium]